MNILIINGPNLNLLGIREPEIYQNNSYQELVNFLNDLGNKKQINIEVFQSNHEGAIIDKIHEGYFQHVDAIIINPGAYTHYSYAIRDAIVATSIPTIEVHLSDITQRENWRKISVISDVCVKTFMGEHFKSYEKAIEYLINERNSYAK